MDSYREGRSSLGEYVEKISKVSSPGPATRRFLEALELEKSLDFNRVEKERASLVEALASQLNPAKIKELMIVGVSYRMGRVSHGDFYRYLHKFCEGAGLSLKQWPSMDKYLRYVFLSDGIDPQKLIAELTALEKAGYANLTRNSGEKNFVAQTRRLLLTGKLLDFSLTPEEWREYKEASVGNSTTTGIPSRREISSFESFYEEAHLRDEALNKNLLKAMEDLHARTAAVVVGGFHAGGIIEKLRRAGVAVISFVPKITHVETSQGSAYLVTPEIRLPDF